MRKICLAKDRRYYGAFSFLQFNGLQVASDHPDEYTRLLEKALFNSMITWDECYFPLIGKPFSGIPSLFGKPDVGFDR